MPSPEDRTTVADVGEDALVSAVVARLRTGVDPRRTAAGAGAGRPRRRRGRPRAGRPARDEHGHARRGRGLPARLVERGGGGPQGRRPGARRRRGDGGRAGRHPRCARRPRRHPGRLVPGPGRRPRRRGRPAGVEVLGGDVADGGALVVTGTSFGVLAGSAPPVRRDGARPGDVVALGGEVGWSAAGLACLLAGEDLDDRRRTRDAVARALAVHRAPQPDHTAGPRARDAGATALIDVSDGLVRDACGWRAPRASCSASTRGRCARRRTWARWPAPAWATRGAGVGAHQRRGARDARVLPGGCGAAGGLLAVGVVGSRARTAAGRRGRRRRRRRRGLDRVSRGGGTHYGRRP